MLFTDSLFLFVFLPLVLGIYYAVNNKFKNIILLIFSLLFYSWGEKEMIILLILSAIVDFYAAKIIVNKNKKLGLYISLFFNLGILLYFKYSNFALENINYIISFFGLSDRYFDYFRVVMPLGISFYTFQTMSYTIDVYRGKIKASNNFINFITYVSLFPQLVAGPIVRYEEVQDQLVNKQISLSNFSYGIERFVKGLFKKIFIANNLAYVSDIGFETVEGYGTLINWICIILFTLYVYYDVSGYSDMAIGLGKMLGFNFPENFNYPYLASSIQDFWRRWHITMSSWFKDYVYISLGGNRKSERRILINIFIVFAVTGLWHGSAWNFIFWGIWHGIFLIFEKLGLLNFIPKQLRNIYVLLVVIFGLVIFRTDSLSNALIFISNMFNYKEVYDFNILNFYFRYEIIFATVLAVIFLFPVYSKLKNTLKMKVSNEYLKLSIKLVSLSITLLVCYTYMAIGAYNPFIYFRF